MYIKLFLIYLFFSLYYQSSPVIIQDNNPGKNSTITKHSIRKGEYFTVELVSQRTSEGYSWIIIDSSNTKKCLEYINQTYSNLPNLNFAGASGIQSFHFKTINICKINLKFLYINRLSSSASDTLRKELQIKVKK